MNEVHAFEKMNMFGQNVSACGVALSEQRGWCTAGLLSSGAGVQWGWCTQHAEHCLAWPPARTVQCLHVYKTCVCNFLHSCRAFYHCAIRTLFCIVISLSMLLG